MLMAPKRYIIERTYAYLLTKKFPFRYIIRVIIFLTLFLSLSLLIYYSKHKRMGILLHVGRILYVNVWG